MNHRVLTLFFAAVGAQACADDGSPVPSRDNVVQTEGAQSTIDTLMVVVGIRIEDAAGTSLDPYDDGGHYLDFAHVTEVRLAADGAPWGSYAAVDPMANEPPELTAGEWGVNTHATEALIVAQLGDEAGAPDWPSTVGEWVGHLLRRLPAGGHVAEIEEVVLTDNAGTAFTVRPRAMLPFETRDGDTTAVIGDVTIGFGGAP